MARLNEIKERRAGIAVERAELAEHLARLDAGAQDEGTEQRWREHIERNAALSKEDARLAQLEAIAETNAEAERRAAGKPVGGGAPAMELRVFNGPATPAPQGFDGEVLRGQDGSLTPVLEARHRFVDFVPRTEQRAQAERFGLGRMMRAMHLGGADEHEQRAMGESTAGAGGVMVPTVLAGEIFDMARTKAIATRSGVRTVPLTSQTTRFVQILSVPTPTFRAEHAPITEGDPTFGPIEMVAKTTGLLIRASREIAEDARNFDATVRAILAKAMAQAIDTAVFYGPGTGSNPRGIALTPGLTVVSMGTNGAALSAGWAKMLDAVTALETVNEGDISAMVMSPRTARFINGMTDSSGQPLSMPPRLANIPQLVSTTVPNNEVQGTAVNASSILLGDFSQALLGLRTALQITPLVERYADLGQLAWVAWARMDVAVVRPAAIARISGITA